VTSCGNKTELRVVFFSCAASDEMSLRLTFEEADVFIAVSGENEQPGTSWRFRVARDLSMCRR